MTTNQAFIKVYRNDPAETKPARPASAAAVASTVEFAAASSGQLTAAYDTEIPHALREGLGEGSAIQRQRAGSAFPTCDAPFGRVDRPTGTASIGKRPLSSYTSSRRTSLDILNSDTPVAKFEPATTVASFAWPGICRALCQQCATELDRVADRLVQEAESGRPTIGLIGLFPQVGTTTTALCIAARLAARRRRAIVVEGNFLAPRLARWLDATPTAWWQDVLERGVPTADAVVRAADDNLDLLPLEAKSPNPLRLAASEQASATASALREAYELVLVDLGPFFDPHAQPIALELVRNLAIDAVLAITGPQGGDPRDLATLTQHLGQSGCTLLGTIENRIAKTQV